MSYFMNIAKIDHFLIRIKFIVICCLLGITLHAQVPVVDFSASTTSGCGPLAVTFTDHSTNKPLSWAWDFGNGQISSSQNPGVVYTNPGTYTVTLIAKNSSGAASIVKTDYITVFPYPSANFISDLQVGCAPATIHFTDQSTPGQGSNIEWTWDFGEGGSSNLQNPTHTFTQTGYYNISLTVKNSGGCSRNTVLYRYIRIVPGVQPDFTWSQTSTSCSAPFNINFINQTSGPGNLSYSWDLGNSTTSNAKNPATSYPSNTSYDIKLMATSDLGCSATKTKSVTFQGNAPVITAPANACLNTPVTFQNASTPAPLASSWDFGDGTTSTFPNPQKTYNAVGTYTVTLTNTYASCSSTSTKTIDVVTTPPASFTSDKTTGCKSPFNVSFTDQTTGGIGWLWDFGDGQTSTLKDPIHAYNSLGNFDVTLTVTTNSGCTNTLTKPQYIKLAASTAGPYASTAQGCVGIPIHVVPYVSSLDGVASFLWTAPGATPSTSTAPGPAFTYNAEGNYDLTLQITTNGGCTFTQTFPGIAVIGNQVAPQFAANPTTSCARQPITFTSPSAPVDKWLWIFGDGDTSQSKPPVTHKYVDTGYNDVILSVTNHGCTLSDTAKNFVYITAPLAGFRYQIDCADRHNVSFTDTSMTDPTKGPAAYKWDFGDGATSLAQNPGNHLYPDLNPKTVTLIVSQGSCSDTVKTTISLQNVIPSFTISPNPSCKFGQFTLTSTSTPASAIDSFTWTVNMVTRTLATPVFKTGITDTGAYAITLKVTDKGGCSYSVNNNIQITAPSAKFAPNIGGCKNSPVTFTDQSIPYNAGSPITSWYWNFGDGNSVTTTTPTASHTYADTGTYDITLAIKDTKGCVDTITVPSTAKITSAKAGFFADTLYCPNAPVPFTDSSKGNNLIYSWDFGDGSAAPTAPGSTDQNPVHPYANNGQYYSVKLKVTDGTGCSDSVTRSNYIHIQQPIASFILQDSTGICVPLQASFIPTGKFYDSLYWNFGDGQTSTLDTTTHFYNNFGQPANNYAFTAMLILQGAGGCRDTAKRNVYVFLPFNTSSLTFSPLQNCDSVEALFSASPTPYTDFAFNFGDGTADSSGNQSPTHTYRNLGTFSPQLVLTDASGCIATRNNGNITVLGAVPIYSSDKKATCDTGTVYFQGIVITNDGQSQYTWDFGDGTTLTGVPSTPPNDPFLSQFHYYSQPGAHLASLKVTTNNGCNETYTDTIHIWQTPHPLISSDGPLCTGLIQFHGDVTLPNVDSVSWAWTFSNGSSSGAKDPYLNFPPGPLTAHLKSSVAFGCSDTTSQSLTILPLPEIKGPKVITTPVGIPVTLPFSYSSNVSTYTWSPSTYLDCTDCPTPVSTPTFNTTYTIKVTDENHCVSIDTVLVKTICNGENYFIPNTFSPNRDGVNDVFYPRGRGLYNIQGMRIFNRWGELVFQRKDFPANTESMGWDGTINGRPAPSDAYVYIIDVICINAQVIALKGDVTLIR